MKLDISISTGYNQALVQSQHFSQKQIQGLKILAMDGQELKAFLESEFLSNPVLEYQETSQTNTDSGSSTDSDKRKDPWNYWLDQSRDLKDFLKSQLSFRGEEEFKIKIFLIECLDDDGFFTMSLDYVSSLMRKPVDLVKKCIDELKKLEPAGVFSKNVEECLLYQIRKSDMEISVLSEMILHHLEDIAKGNFNKISKVLSLPMEEVMEYIGYIRTLNPYPAQGFGGSDGEFIIPDVILRKSDQWDIELNDSWTENYFISDYYVQLIRETQDEELKAYLTKKLERVQWIIRSIEQRRSTLKNIMQEIVKVQKNYFEEQGELCPMTMKEIADEMEVHLSTVSRAIKNKYLQYPKGTILIKDLFSQNVNKNSDAKEVNSDIVKRILEKWILCENQEKPYSDQTLKRMLEEKEIVLSRRTVTKYREELGIKSSFERKMLD